MGSKSAHVGRCAVHAASLCSVVDEERLRDVEELVSVALAGVCKKISISRGTLGPARSSQSRIVSADEFGVVTMRI